MSGRPSMEYEGFDLAVGEIYGLRVWQIDEYGRLRARHLTQQAPPWVPGVNTATCLVSAVNVTITAAATAALGSVLAGVTCTCRHCRPKAGPPEHAAPSESCKCGFYAYTGLGQEVVAQAGVIGVIRGTGRTLVGAKGFRCEKAEIVALLDPASEDSGFQARWGGWLRELLGRNYAEVPLIGSLAALRQFAPIESTAPHPSTDEFWSLP